jgi:hypothetical protein
MCCNCRFSAVAFVVEVADRQPAGSGDKENVMKQYLMSVYYVEGQPEVPEAQRQQMYSDVDAFNQKLQAGEQWVFAGGLYPPTSATVVTATGGEVITTDGPYPESKEQLGGFWVINANDLDAALALAAEASTACQGPVEVRPFQDEPA